jgi:hypothetical protein
MRGDYLVVKVPFDSRESSLLFTGSGIGSLSSVSGASAWFCAPKKTVDEI